MLHGGSLQCGIPKGEGRVLASALSVELKTDEKLVRSSGVPDVSDFTVDFIKADNLEDSPVKHFRYGDMPEVVTLPVGEYVAGLIMVETMAAKGGRPLSLRPIILESLAASQSARIKSQTISAQ